MPARRCVSSRLFTRCPKTGRIVGFRRDTGGLVWLLPLIGLIALLWYLIRVLPKPSRALYPCQRIAAPLASGFVAWIAGFGAVTFFFRKARQNFRDSRITAALLFCAAALVAVVWTAAQTSTPAYAYVNRGLDGLFKPLATAVATEIPIDSTHATMGIARGTFPGRVVWNHDPGATKPGCTNGAGDYWWQDGNTVQAYVDSMLSTSLRRLTGATTDSLAWVELFHYFNRTHNRGDVGYAAGEKIFIKVNLCSGYPLLQTLSYTKTVNDQITMIDTSPQMMRALLRQLVNVAGVAPPDIRIGDPMRPFFSQFYTMIHGEFPTVVYLDPWGTSGRTKVTATAAAAVFLSGKNGGPAVSYKLPQQVVDARYTINLACLKAHDGAGVSLCAKNQFGNHAFACTASNCYGDPSLSNFLHFSLPSTGSMYLGTPGMGHYRVEVDLMGHKDLDGKGLIFIVDGLWGAGASTYAPNKWKSAPFDNDWPSSILVSQDEVALESVCFDLLRTEYRAANGYDTLHTYPNTLYGAEDYLHQAADPAAWPAGIVYDPENDGTPIGSLGVHEHWNNSIDKKYSRDLDPVNGTGIELVLVTPDPTAAGRPAASASVSFEARAEGFGPVAHDVKLVIDLPRAQHVTVRVFDIRGRQVAVPVDRDLAAGRHIAVVNATAGDYVATMQAGSFVKTVAFQQAR